MMRTNVHGVEKMPKNRAYTAEEKQQILEEVANVGNIPQVASKYDIPKSTIHTWLKKTKPKKKKATSSEINKLKAQLSDSELENAILKDLLKKTYQVWKTD